MGNSITPHEKDLLTSHPQFKSAKLIHHKDHYSITSRVSCDEETYDQWKNMLDRDIKKLKNSDFLLIPNTYNFEKDNFCGSTGHVEVSFIYHTKRLTTNPIRTCFLRKSPEGEKVNNPLLKPTYGSCCMHLLAPNRR